MTHLNESEFLDCPYHRARHYLAETLQSASETGAAQTLRLRVPIAGGSSGGPEKDVLVTYGRGADPMHFDEPWSVRWEPLGGGPYPTFTGEITVRADERYETCILELRGSYEPPLGAAGKAFDAIIGSHAAAATARALLQDIGGRMVSRYRSEESEKATQP